LLWVINKLKAPDIGVQFKDAPPCPVQSDPLAPRHRAWVDDPAWDAVGVASRRFPAGVPVDGSVRQRMTKAAEVLFGDPGNQPVYAPGNLPA
jgi:hypothetical protein